MSKPMRKPRPRTQAQRDVLTSESRPRFEAILQTCLGEYQPQGPTEEDLLEEMVAAEWLQRRCWYSQTALLDVTTGRHARDYHRALDQLREIQQERREKQNPPNEPEAAEPVPNHQHPSYSLFLRGPQSDQPLPTGPLPLLSSDFSHIAVPTAVFPISL